MLSEHRKKRGSFMGAPWVVCLLLLLAMVTFGLGYFLGATRGDVMPHTVDRPRDVLSLYHPELKADIQHLEDALDELEELTWDLIASPSRLYSERKEEDDANSKAKAILDKLKTGATLVPVAPRRVRQEKLAMERVRPEKLARGLSSSRSSRAHLDRSF
eukprot:g43149.t1